MSFNFGNYEAVVKTFYLEIFIRALAYLSEYRLVLVRFLSLPIVLYFLTKIPLFAYLGIYAPLFLSILGYLLYIIVAVMIHRVLILGPSSVNAFSIRTWSNRETYFFLRTIGLTLIASVF